MDYYVTKKAGSIIFRAPRKHHLVAGDHVPPEVWSATASDVRAELLRSGMVEGFDDPDSVVLDDPEPESLPRVGVGKHEFMAEAHVQRGERRDRALEELAREQERRRRESEVDVERGGSADGVVKVEMPPEDDEDVDFDEGDLTPEELAEIRRMESEED